MGGKRRETPIASVFIRCSCTFVFDRHPQVHCEGVDVRERIWPITSLIASSAKQSAERTLNDGIVDPEFRCESVLMPARRHYADTSRINSSSTGTPRGRLATP
jgi:hypothetical protein